MTAASCHSLPPKPLALLHQCEPCLDHSPMVKANTRQHNRGCGWSQKQDAWPLGQLMSRLSRRLPITNLVEHSNYALRTASICARVLHFSAVFRLLTVGVLNQVLLFFTLQRYTVGPALCAPSF